MDGLDKNAVEVNIYYTIDDLVNTEKQNWETIKVDNGNMVCLPLEVTALFATEKLIDGSEWSSELVRLK